jgi:hypothetical protein
MPACWICGLLLLAGSQPTVELPMPTRLSVQRTADSLSISYDLASLRKIRITPGESMSIGMKSELWVYIKGGQRPVRPGSIGYASIQESATALWKSTTILHSVPDGIPLPGKNYIVAEDISLFETDIPPQHMWSPEGGRKYRVLWETKLKTDRVLISGDPKNGNPSTQPHQ